MGRGQEQRTRALFYSHRRVSIGCWNLPEVVPSEHSGMIVRSDRDAIGQCIKKEFKKRGVAVT
jgi:hypothetical protein